VLDRLLTKIGYTYELINHNVVVAPKPNGPAPNAAFGDTESDSRPRARLIRSMQLPTTNRSERVRAETAQQIVTGIVRDEQGKPLGGVSIAVKGSNHTDVT